MTLETVWDCGYRKRFHWCSDCVNIMRNCTKERYIYDAFCAIRLDCSKCVEYFMCDKAAYLREQKTGAIYWSDFEGSGHGADS